MNDTIIILIGETTTVDEYGDLVRTPIERPVFAEEKSVGQTEFYQAAAAGLRPEIKFVLADYLDYQGEKRLRYTPFAGTEEEYTVVRTYRKDERLEIVCRKGLE